MGLFYIATFIDKSDKLFKGTASTGTVLQLLAYSTPQFVYYVIPIAALLSVLVTFGMLSRTSELTVMKACGVSLYRIALPDRRPLARLERRALWPRAGDPRAREPARLARSTTRSAAARPGC